ncbi:MAG: hypothetical protein OEU83_10390, partial [Gammaproteobacteria bacterium]|nr:hypothetical protein [Gammaproteobacteria bacterium]
VSAEIVTADGQVRTASADENPDLFWGLRGGGGNFGVVTDFEYQLHPFERNVLSGSIVWPYERPATYWSSTQRPRRIILTKCISGRPRRLPLTVCESS